MKKTTLDDFIAGCRAKHPDKNYDYSAVTDFLGMKHKVTVICPDHGPFSIRGLGHYYHGKGCEYCGRKRKGDRSRGPERGSAKAKLGNYKANFLTRAQEVHGNFYDYSQTVYSGARKKVTINCPKHGAFEQTADKHLRGRGCWSCGQKSSQEEELWAFVSGLTATATRRDRQVIGPKELDIWVADKSLAIEFCGLYYHSTQTLNDGMARKKHVVKYVACRAKGIRLLTIFEDEWATRRPQIEAIIRRVIDPGKGIGARRCALTDEADFHAFYERNHIQGPPQWGASMGLMFDGELVAAMTFGQGAARRGGGDWELSRFATSRSISGGASRLMSALVQKTGAARVWSYSDNRYFDGGMYAHLGFKLDGELPPDYSIVRNSKRSHKSSFRRASIPSRIREVGSTEQFDPATDPRSEREMTDLLGYGRIYDCGKKRWLWTTN